MDAATNSFLSRLGKSLESMDLGLGGYINTATGGIRLWEETFEYSTESDDFAKSLSRFHGLLEQKDTEARVYLFAG